MRHLSSIVMTACRRFIMTATGPPEADSSIFTGSGVFTGL
jgi:hypothetical protein